MSALVLAGRRFIGNKAAELNTEKGYVMAYCRKCGTELSEEAKQCPKCGAETKEKPGCFMLAIGPLLVVLGLTVLFGWIGTIIGLVIAVILLLVYSTQK